MVDTDELAAMFDPGNLLLTGVVLLLKAVAVLGVLWMTAGLIRAGIEEAARRTREDSEQETTVDGLKLIR